MSYKNDMLKKAMELRYYADDLLFVEKKNYKVTGSTSAKIIENIANLKSKAMLIEIAAKRAGSDWSV